MQKQLHSANSRRGDDVCGRARALSRTENPDITFIESGSTSGVLDPHLARTCFTGGVSEGLIGLIGSRWEASCNVQPLLFTTFGLGCVLLLCDRSRPSKWVLSKGNNTRDPLSLSPCGCCHLETRILGAQKPF